MEEDWSYLAIIEMLLYLLTNMRPDIAFAISQVVHFNHNPKKSHATAIKMITRHLLGMLDIYIHIYLYRNVILRYAYTKIYIYILDTVYFWVLQLAKWLPLRAMMWDLKALVRKPPSLTKLILPHIQAEIRPFD
jgi:hypothetical protein